jgi:hypothetical protein
MYYTEITVSEIFGELFSVAYLTKFQLYNNRRNQSPNIMGIAKV